MYPRAPRRPCLVTRPAAPLERVLPARVRSGRERAAKQRVPFVVRLHTEAPSRPCTVYPGLSGLFVDINEPSTLDSAAHSLEEFKALPNLTMVLNVEPREALDDFATADVLILSCSCLGYVGGLLNPSRPGDRRSRFAAPPQLSRRVAGLVGCGRAG